MSIPYWVVSDNVFVQDNKGPRLVNSEGGSIVCWEGPETYPTTEEGENSFTRAYEMFRQLWAGSERKQRLFACACARLLWPSLTSKRSRRAVEAAELYADGLITKKELAARGSGAATAAGEKSWACTLRLARATAYVNIGQARGEAWYYGFVAGTSRETQYDVLRDIIDPRLLPNLLADPSWLRWSDGTVPKIAQGIYDSRDFNVMPILADALEDAGCDNEELLAHCRGPGPHVRGCWALDLLLGRT